MKTKRLFFITLFFTAAMVSISFAQDNTKVGLPEGAIARLGKGGINLMRFSPDGTRLAVGTDVAVWVYDVPSGKETALFTGHTGQVNALAFSTDGKILASSGFQSPIIQLWDLETGSKLLTVRFTEKVVAGKALRALTFSADNTKLISLDNFSNITEWDVSTGSSVANRSGNVGYYKAVAVSKDGNTFATGHQDGRIYLSDSTTGKLLASFRGHQRVSESVKAIVGRADKQPQDQEVLALAFSPDGKMIASGNEVKTVQLWDTQTRSKHATLKGHKEWVTAVAFSADGKTLASGDGVKVIKLWDVGTGRERATLIGHTNNINALTFAPEGTPVYSGCLASGSTDGTIRFWDPDTGQELTTFTAGHTEWIKAVAFAEDGTTLSTAAFNGTVEIWSLKTAQVLTTFTKAAGDLAGAVAFSQDATYFASRGSAGFWAFNPLDLESRGHIGAHNKIQLWDITTGKEIPGPWQDTKDRANALAFSLDKKILVAGRGRQGIHAWDLNTELKLFRFNATEPFGRRLVFSPNGNLLATYGTHVQTRIWDVATHAEITLPNMQKASAGAFSPDGTIFAYQNYQDGIVFWHITPTGMKEHSRIPSSLHGFHEVLIFSPNGKILLDPQFKRSGEFIQLWDVDTGSDLGMLSGHTDQIETLAFSHDGKTLASGSKDGTVLLWDWEKIIDNR